MRKISAQKYVLRFETDIGRRNRLYEDGRVGSVDNGIFIHAIVPRHVECVVLMLRKNT